MTNPLLMSVAGLVIGFLIGLTGMGGGALMTPFLISMMKFDPVLAVGTDLAFASITKIVGGLGHHKESKISFKPVLWMAIGSIPASILGSQFILRQTDNRRLIEDFLPNLLGWTLIIVSIIILARVFRFVGPKKESEVRYPSPWALIGIGASGGVLVGMTSIGGGTVIMALFLLFFSIPLNYLVGMDVMHGALLATISAFSYIFAGQTGWASVGLLLIGSLPGVWLGARIVHRINLLLVRGILGLLVLGAGIQLLLGGH
ncbi:MAG: sulfite exporter TauE/SafE family protein [Anaerolineae bacterium]|nr:sulfite exporter TauE/SafE family protein [Anaerolineae bacterium]